MFFNGYHWLCNFIEGYLMLSMITDGYHWLIMVMDGYRMLSMVHGCFTRTFS